VCVFEFEVVVFGKNSGGAVGELEGFKKVQRLRFAKLSKLRTLNQIGPRLST
jgi:hypothetical protein